jgi:hypothetical protein
MPRLEGWRHSRTRATFKPERLTQSCKSVHPGNRNSWSAPISPGWETTPGFCLIVGAPLVGAHCDGTGRAATRAAPTVGNPGCCSSLDVRCYLRSFAAHRHCFCTRNSPSACKSHCYLQPAAFGVHQQSETRKPRQLAWPGQCRMPGHGSRRAGVARAPHHEG